MGRRRRRPAGTLSATAIQHRIRSVDSEIAAIEKQAEELDQRRSNLRIKRETYAELLSDLKPESSSGNGTKPETGPSATSRILEYFGTHPGARPAVAVEQLLGQIPTKAKNPRKNLYQMILNLKHQERLEADSGGGLRIKSATTATR